MEPVFPFSNDAANPERDPVRMDQDYVSQSNEFDLRGFFLDLVRSVSLRPSTVTVDEKLHSDIRRLSICVDQQDFEMFAQLDGRAFLVLQTVMTAVIRREKMLATIEVVNRQTGGHLGQA